MASLRAVLNTAELPSDPHAFKEVAPPVPGTSTMQTSAPEVEEFASKAHSLVKKSEGELDHEEEQTEVSYAVKVWTPVKGERPPASERQSASTSENGVRGESPKDRERESPPSLPDHLPDPSRTFEAPSTPTHPQSTVPQQATAVVQGQSTTGGETARLRRELDVRTAFSGLPKVSPHWTHRYMKMLIVGESGLGKTTFVKNLFAAYAKDPNFPVNDASTSNAHQVFERNPQHLCTEIVLQDHENKVWYHYLVQDTPGYGDSTDLEGDRQVVLDYIRNNNRMYLDQEQSPDRRVALHDLKDTRVDVCLYFVPPHRLRKMDVNFMHELSELVPVLPVLAKADTMTSEELKEFRHRVRKALEKAGVLWRFSHDSLEEAGARHGPPFAIIGSNTMDLSIGRYWPVRKYPWGSCEAMLTAHSDLPALRRLLFETGYLELKQNTEKRYHEYRRTTVEGGEYTPLKPVRTLFKLAGAVVLTGLISYLTIHGVPEEVKEDLRESKTVKKVKAKVGEAVDEVKEGVSEAVGTVKDRASDAGSTAKKNAQKTLDRAADKAAEKLEGEAGKRRRAEEKNRERYRRAPWWKIWGE